ncbi:MAG: DNA-protecting protein DprA [Verrucomicrobiales bacterium]|nr:DNA-protecting protein DprA [Verrucomicrobiales bacterium]|tara:strand:- start:157 stop:1263 length:1107 start_codon:yes stop_codon:yes gene_type:complete
MESKEAFIALNMVEGIGPIRVRKLLEHFGEPQAILSASKLKLEQVPGVGPEVSDKITGWKDKVRLDEELKRIEEFGCQVITQDDEGFPSLLREIYDPPIVLYVRGQILPKDKNSIAMVGSRQTTHYGIETGRKLGYQLAYAGVTVVSGGARGIDTAAHQGALSAKGRTIAVLGTGINIVFPTENRELFERIASSGAVISQFPFNRPADKQSFPIRNRIVAGMTLGSVVVEANLTSGSLITARFATDYGRQVFAVPGRIDSPRSKGCHDLIKKGAKLCEDVEDVLDEFEYLFPASNRPASPAETGVLPGIDLDEEETRVLDVIGKGELSVDEIIRETGLPASKANVLLMRLQMKKLIQQLPGRIYRLNK